MEMEQRLGYGNAIPPPGGGTTTIGKTGGGGTGTMPHPKCELDSKGCLTLASILESFSVISEEHAWALCYQCAKCGKNILNDPQQRGTCLLVTHTDHLLIHRDGQVHPDTFITDLPGGIPGKGPPRTKCSCECKIIANLAAVIFHALDFGLAEDEERHLSAELESLLDAMASAGESAERPETDDEGIERDSGDSDDDRISSRAFNFDSILDICTRRLGSSASSSSSSSSSTSSNNKENNSSVICNGNGGNSTGGGGGSTTTTSTTSMGASTSNHISNNSGNSSSGNATADAHYKAVCRALVAEALELSTFLQKVAQGTQQLRSISSYSSARSGYSSAFSNYNSSSGYSGFNSLGSAFLDHDPDLEKLNFTDWARLWVQVIRELRNGVKLKKVDSSYHDCSRGPPIEYELTPYEILMDDIRSRRYKLNKVMVDGSLPPRIKKDAHAIILEFIRSRPPLKKVTDRVLPPPPKKQSNPIELLMESIRQEHHLRPINRRKESTRLRGRRLNSCENTTNRSMTENNSCLNNNKSSPVSSSNPHGSHPGGPTTTTDQHQSNNQTQQQPQRRLIKADLDLLYSFDTKDEDDDDDEDEDEDDDDEDDLPASEKKMKKKKKKDKENGSDSSCFFGHICPEGTQSSPATPWKKPADPKVFEDEDSNGRRVDFRRRHTICNPTNRDEHGSTLITFPFEYTNTVNVFSSLQCPRASPILHRRKAKLPHSVSKSYLQEEFFQSNHWQTAIECLSLNLEEVVHIRNVLTKAELESLPVDCSLKEDVEKGKVCFLCLKTRFSLLFGPWGNTCKLCKRTVCAKCCAKMRIPTEHFAKVPVSTLSPNISPRDEEKDFIPKSLTPTNGSSHRSSDSNSLPPPNMTRKNSVGSAPTSPNLSSRRSLLLGLDSASDLSSGGNQQQSRSISPAGLDSSSSDQDRYSPDHHHHHSSNGPHSLPTVTSISLGLMAFKKRNFGRGKDADKTEKLKGSLMVVCHDCKAMVLQIIRSSRAKKANTTTTTTSNLLSASSNPSPHHPRTNNLPLELAGIRA